LICSSASRRRFYTSTWDVRTISRASDSASRRRRRSSVLTTKNVIAEAITQELKALGFKHGAFGVQIGKPSFQRVLLAGHAFDRIGEFAVQVAATTRQLLAAIRGAPLCNIDLDTFPAREQRLFGLGEIEPCFQIGHAADFAGVVVFAHLLYPHRHLGGAGHCAHFIARRTRKRVLRQHGAGRDQRHHHRLPGAGLGPRIGGNQRDDGRTT